MREAHACPPKHVHRTTSGIVHTVAQPRAANSTRIQILVNVFGTWTHENRMLSYPRVVGADWLRYKHDITIKSTLKMLCFALECLASGLAFQRAATQFGEHSDVKLSSLARWGNDWNGNYFTSYHRLHWVTCHSNEKHTNELANSLTSLKSHTTSDGDDGDSCVNVNGNHAQTFGEWLDVIRISY